ncbi:MAG: PhzF family phenazine biosynthesis protein [Tahibacter sp.]
MPQRRFMQLDVFSASHGKGNPLAVVVDAQDLDTAQMQHFAAWTNLSETAFLLPAIQAGADYRLRIFTPRQELPFAGHPSVGAAWVAVENGMAHTRDGALLQECAAGLLPVRIDESGPNRRISIRAPQAKIRLPTEQELRRLAEALPDCGINFHTIRHVDNGPAWWIVNLRDETCVRTLQPDLAAIATLSRECDVVGLAVYARIPRGDMALVTRVFCPADGIAEDPVTGSANAAIAAVLHATKALDEMGHRWCATQGRELGRDGRVHVEIEDTGAVWIGGECAVAIRGLLDWP